MATFITAVKRHRAAHQQIEESIRARILSGELLPGSRLPSNDAIAAATGTSVFTVQTALARLTKDGLLERKRKVGTFVAGSGIRLSCAGLYLNADIWTDPELRFYQIVCNEVRRILADAGVSTKIWMDDRPDGEQDTPPLSLSQALQKREIQALIVPKLGSMDLVWLKTLEIPTAYLTNNVLPRRVGYDWAQFMQLALERLREQGCRKVGLITGTPSATATPAPGGLTNDAGKLLQSFITKARKLKLQVRDEWIRSPSEIPVSKKDFGYVEFSALWAAAERPDGLIVFPDTAVSGVLMAAMARHVAIPDELKLVLHANEQMPYPCPVPATQILTRESDVAKSLVRIVREQLQAREAPSIAVRFSAREVSGGV